MIKKHRLTFDEELYITSMAVVSDDSTGEDVYSFDDLLVELEFINAYKIVNDDIYLDEAKKAEIIAERESKPTYQELAEAQMLLNAEYAGAPIVLYPEGDKE